MPTRKRVFLTPKRPFCVCGKRLGSAYRLKKHMETCRVVQDAGNHVQAMEDVENVGVDEGDAGGNLERGIGDGDIIHLNRQIVNEGNCCTIV